MIKLLLVAFIVIEILYWLDLQKEENARSSHFQLLYVLQLVLTVLIALGCTLHGARGLIGADNSHLVTGTLALLSVYATTVLSVLSGRKNGKKLLVAHIALFILMSFLILLHVMMTLRLR